MSKESEALQKIEEQVKRLSHKVSLLELRLQYAEVFFGKPDAVYGWLTLQHATSGVEAELNKNAASKAFYRGFFYRDDLSAAGLRHLKNIDGMEVWVKDKEVK